MKRERWEYVALRTLSHRETGAQIEQGELVDLSHCTPDEIEMLVAQDTIERRKAGDITVNAVNELPPAGAEGA